VTIRILDHDAVMPHTVAMLVYPGFELLDTTGPASVLAGASRALRRVGKRPFYVVETISAAGGLVESSSGVAVHSRALAMVGRDLGGAIAGEVAKRLVLYARRPGHQSQFSTLLRAQVQAENPFDELIGWMQTHLDRPLDIATLARRAGLSERTFHRKFVTATGETPARFVESLRLEAARLLLSQKLSIKTIAAHIGLSPTARSPRRSSDASASLPVCFERYTPCRVATMMPVASTLASQAATTLRALTSCF
jgi:transcriptional regulator GlxA family with amidase domain